MNRKIAFTIVARNYVGLANVLGESIKKFDPEVDFFVFIADEMDVGFELPHNNYHYESAKICLGFEETEWNTLAFQYNLTEFCTALKPFCFRYLINRFVNCRIIYADPDILFFSGTEPIWRLLEKHTILITPHIITPEVSFSGDIIETNLLGSGIYNLGFIAVKSSNVVDEFISWWCHRLRDRCFIDKQESLYTDQRWIDFLPSFYGESDLLIVRDMGWNLAPWNFYERKVYLLDETWLVKHRLHKETPATALLFVHYSGFNYLRLSGDNRNIPYLKTYSDASLLFDKYTEMLRGEGIEKYFGYNYTYNFFENGAVITHFHRRMFRRFAQVNQSSHPFQITGTFYKLLKKHNLLLTSGENPDKMNERAMTGFDNKLKWINRLHRLLYKVLGLNRYSLYTKFMLRYYRPENQTFLMQSKHSDYTFWNENFKMHG
jgi:hypothetical protein